MKYAVYVEGLSEMLFVTDVLQKHFNYDSKLCGFRCINLRADNFEKLPYPQLGDEQSDNYYQIVNVNNDNRVISKLKQDIPNLIANEYDVIIGLKDVYGDAYKKLMNQDPVVDRAKIEKLHYIQTRAINVTQTCDCRLHFAIMEYETWMLALINNYVINKGFDLSILGQQLNIDIECDFEQNVYHPFNIVRKICNICGDDYHKHGKESFSFLSVLSMDDYNMLRSSGRCASFAKFLDSLLGGPCPTLP